MWECRRARDGGYGVGDGVLVDSLTSDGFSKLQLDVDGFMKMAKISKLDMMQYATECFRRTAACYSDGIMKSEIAHVVVKNRGAKRREGEVWISQPQLKLAEDVLPKTFVPRQASSANVRTKSTVADGGACVVLCGDEFIRESGVAPIARILDCCEVSTDAASFPEALVHAVREVNRGVNRRVDIYDILDQYAFLPLYVAKSLGIDHSHINVHGGAISIGHPMGRF
ncbi:thiolase family protein [Babesia caballi]|uniref:Thiolase family protein n=1 Tax=Babesia caballi TaxID=5871 RepID=A0AAV4LVK3_BABCB|nr:thiolase family protein [Babesia caballi]